MNLCLDCGSTLPEDADQYGIEYCEGCAEMTTELTNDQASYAHILAALQKTRSIAAENGDAEALAMLEPLVSNPKTVEYIADLAMGVKTADYFEWMNVCSMVRLSPTWEIGLGFRGVKLPTELYALQDRR